MRRLFLGTLCVVALLTKTDPQSAHEYSRLGTVESIVNRGTYQLDGSTFIDTLDKIYRGGHFYSHQPPLLPTLEAPVYWLLHLPGTGFNNRGRFAMTYAFSLLTNGIALALTVVVFASLLTLAGVASPQRDWLAVLLPFGTWLLPYGIVSNSHGISALLVAQLGYLLLLIEWQGITNIRAVSVGAVLGLLIAIEILPIVSFAPLALIYLAVRKDLNVRAWWLVAAGLALPLVAHAIINVRITGDVIPAGFHHELFNYPGSVFDDSNLTGGIKFHSLGEFVAYAWTALVAGRGFFTFAPLCLLGLAVGAMSWDWWSRARGPHLVMLGGVILSVGAALVSTNAYGGEAVGFRHAAYLCPALLILLMPWLIEPRRRSIVTAVATISCVLMLVFAARNPWKALSWSAAPIGTWDQYMPIAGRTVHRDLFKP